MADQMATKMSMGTAESSSQKTSVPKKGEKYRCDECGMEIQVNKECGCKNPEHAHFQCCNQEMSKT